MVDDADLKGDSPEARAKRLRYVRNEVIHKSRPYLTKKYGIPPSTLQNWEDLRFGGLTEEGARRMVEIFKGEGFNCTLQWLLYSIEDDPNHGQLAGDRAVDIQSMTDAAKLAEELKVFHRLHASAVDYVVTDDGLAPCPMPGDYVAGERYFEQDLHKALGLFCIAQTYEGQTLTRKVEAGTKANCYTLICSNPHTTVEKPIIKDVQLFSAAPILWIRKRLKD